MTEEPTTVTATPEDLLWREAYRVQASMPDDNAELLARLDVIDKKLNVIMKALGLRLS